MSYHEHVIYRAGRGWKGRSLSLIPVGIFTALMIGGHEVWISSWSTVHWFWQAWVIVGIVVFFLLPLESFISETIFTTNSIAHRSLFGVKSERSYSDVVGLIKDIEFLQIEFKGGKKLKIMASLGKPEDLIAIIQTHTTSRIPVSIWGYGSDPEG